MISRTLWQRLPRSSLWDLLGDMLLPVLELLAPSELYALSLVSKESHASCEPFLYSGIEWTWLEDRPPPILPFIRTILRRPELAAHVRSISLLGESFISYDEKRSIIPPRIDIAALDYEDAVKAMERTKVDFTPSWKKFSLKNEWRKVSWKEDLSQGAMDALLALLLPQIHQVTHLELGPMFTFETRFLSQLFFAALFKQADHDLPTYQYLRKLSINFGAKFGRTIYGLKSVELLPFFYMPVVQDLQVVSSMPMGWGQYGGWPMEMQAPTSSMLTSLHLAAIEPEHLGYILSRTPALKRLHYNWYYRSGVHLGRPEEGSVWVSLDTLGRALGHVRETLEELVITGRCSIEEDHEYPFLDFQGTFKGIIDLGCLKTLQIPLPFLTGNFEATYPIVNFDARRAITVEDVIPKKVETLTITDDTLLEWPWEPEWEDTAVSFAVGRWLMNLKFREITPVLDTLVLKEVVKEWSPVMKEEISKVCQHYGIEFQVQGS